MHLIKRSIAALSLRGNLDFHTSSPQTKGKVLFCCSVHIQRLTVAVRLHAPTPRGDKSGKACISRSTQGQHLRNARVACPQGIDGITSASTESKWPPSRNGHVGTSPGHSL